jgi:hypothetical protein
MLSSCQSKPKPTSFKMSVLLPLSVVDFFYIKLTIGIMYTSLEAGNTLWLT